MTSQLHDAGEEYLIKQAFDGTISRETTVTVGLFNDATDTLLDSDDLAAITTEPAGASYARQSVTLNSTDVTVSQSGGDWQAVLKDLTFDTSDSTQSVDGYFVVMNVQLSGDGAATDHLIWSGDLDQTYDLTSVSSFVLSGEGVSLT